MIKNEFYFSSANKKARMRAVEWLPEGEPKAVLQVFRGMTGQEYCYKELAEYFAERGFVVVVNGNLGDGESLSEQEVIYNCLITTKEKYPDVPYLLLGLVRGALTVQEFVSKYSGKVEGVVLADAEPNVQNLQEELQVLCLSGIEEKCPEAFSNMHRWTEERLDEMLYWAATKQ